MSGSTPGDHRDPFGPLASPPPARQTPSFLDMLLGLPLDGRTAKEGARRLADFTLGRLPALGDAAAPLGGRLAKAIRHPDPETLCDVAAGLSELADALPGAAEEPYECPTRSTTWPPRSATGDGGGARRPADDRCGLARPPRRPAVRCPRGADGAWALPLDGEELRALPDAWAGGSLRALKRLVARVVDLRDGLARLEMVLTVDGAHLINGSQQLGRFDYLKLRNTISATNDRIRACPHQTDPYPAWRR